MQANLRAVAVVALAGPRWAFFRLKNIPRHVLLLRPTAWAARRKAVATRLITLRVRLSSTLPPLILLPGQRPSQEQNALALRHLVMSTPISETMSSTLITLSPTT